MAFISCDLRALSRVATMASEINDVKRVVLDIIDKEGGRAGDWRPADAYRWASLQREGGSRVKDERAIERVQSEKELREVTVTAANGYRVEVSVPTKRNLVSANNRVYIRNIIVDSTGFDGKPTHHEIPVNAWVSPGDANGTSLPEMGKSVKVMAELGVENGEKKAVATVAVLQAKLVDDPSSPDFPAVKRPLMIREVAAKKDIDRGILKNTIDEALLAVPGELEKRTAEQTAAAARRKEGAAGSAIAGGDATPDVVAALQEINRLLGGNLDDQTGARMRLKALIESLQPKPAAQ